MKIGICTSLEKASLAVEAGFDYVELSVSEIAQRDPWGSTLYAGLPIEACNLFFPGDVRLFDTTWTLELRRYLSKARQRLDEVGVSVAVVGSGNQRRCPDGISFPFDSGLVDFPANGTNSAEEFFARCIAQFLEMPGSVLLAPESLNRTETNVGNDCGEFAKVLSEYAIGYTADAYHILFEWDANGREDGQAYPSKQYWEDQLPFAPTHVHLAQLEGRRAPGPGDLMLVGFFERLKELGYNDRISLECSGLEPDGYAHAIASLKTYLS